MIESPRSQRGFEIKFYRRNRSAQRFLTRYGRVSCNSAVFRRAIDLDDLNLFRECKWLQRTASCGRTTVVKVLLGEKHISFGILGLGVQKRGLPRLDLGMQKPWCITMRMPPRRLHKALAAFATLLSLVSLVGCSGVTAHTTPPPAQDFSILLSPSTVTVGGNSSNSTFTVSVTGQNGFAGSVSVAISGLPAGATTSPATPFSLAAGNSQVVTLSVPATVQAGSYTLTVSGSSGALKHSANLPLTVAAAQDFSIGLSPTTITAAVGTSTSSFTVLVTGQSGFSGTVTVDVAGLPSGVTTSPTCPFTVAPGSSQTVTLSIPAAAQPGDYTLAVSSTSGTLTHAANLALTITNGQDFSISLSPTTVTAIAGTSNASFTVSLTSLNGFAGSVTVSIVGLPSGTTTSPSSPFSVAVGSSQALTLTVASTTPTGNYTVTVTGTSGALTHSANLALTISPPPDFSMVLTPTAITANAGSSNASFAVSITSLNGFTGSITVSITGLPGGTTTSPASPFTVAAGSSQTVVFSVPSTVTSADYSLTVSGSSGVLSHSDSLVLTVLGQLQVTTWHYDNARTSADTWETTLTPSNVNSTTFGKLFTYPVDGIVVGHPLYLPSVTIPGQGVHNVVYVATMHDSVFAFDADNGNAPPLWMTSILTDSPAGATTVPATVTKETGIGWTEAGIISTPVIDPATSTMYLVAETYENAKVVHRLHALDVTTGQEKFGGPTTIVATYTLNGTTTTFTDLYQINRPGLLLANGHVYIAFGSNCCNDYSQGWVLSYNAATLQQEGTYTAEPGKTLASIWQKGAGVSADSSGNLYVETGEGSYTPGTNLSISVLKLSQSGATLALADWFTPYNQQTLSQDDRDLNNAPLILPDQPGPYPHEAIAEGKEGTIYVLNRDNLGQFCSTCTTGDTQIVQEIVAAAPKSGTPVYWNNTVYFTPQSAPVSAYALNNGLIVLPASAQSIQVGGGGHAIITANGSTNGIIWFINSGGPLWAMDAITLKKIYTSDDASNGRDTMPPLAHFATPIAADGKIFVGTQNSVVGYGLLSGSAAAERNGLFPGVAFLSRDQLRGREVGGALVATGQVGWPGGSNP